jgi:competence protein ComGC
MLFPLIGPAYRRAWESSCDRYGAYAAQDVEGSLRAMMILSGGKEHGRTLSADAFAGQHADERGFFVSLHELTASYPTLSRRVSDLLTLKTGQSARTPDRNPFAYFFALFMPGGNAGRSGGGLADTMIVVVIIGLLAAMAIPAFQKVRQASMDKMCINNQRMLAAAFEQQSMELGKPPVRFSEFIGNGPGKYLKTLPVCPLGGTYEIPPGATSGEEIFCSKHGTIQDILAHSASPPTRR